jgi:hypothetical protein
MLRSLIYIAIFAAGAFIGGVFPSYSFQYQQMLYAQSNQVESDLAPFQEIANRYHKGSIETLIQYHLNSEDPTFHDEGIAIRMMVDSQMRLAEAEAAFGASFVDQLFYLYLKGDPELEQATWDTYTPAFVATEQALVFAATVGLLFIALFFLLSVLVRQFFRAAPGR